MLILNSVTEKTTFLHEFTACWELLNKFGKYDKPMDYYHDLFLRELSDLSGNKINRALAHYRKTHAAFPTPAEIRGIVGQLDYELTDHETMYRGMHLKAWYRDKGIFFQGEEDLDLFEAKQGKINPKLTWYDGYDAIFNNDL